MSNHQILNSNDHADLRIASGVGGHLGDAVMATIVVPEEFRSLQAEYPIVFRRDLESGTFTALALFGFENGENLYLRDDRWDARYRPMSMTIQPFLYGRPASGEGDGQVHVDMGHARISKDGEGIRVFDEFGKPTPYLENVAGELGALHAGLEAGKAFLAALDELELLEPFTLNVTLANGMERSLVGFHIVDEARVRALGDKELGRLHSAGHLMPMFMAMASLAQFSALIERKNAALVNG